MGDATFGKYRLIAELGHGGMADVFLAVLAGPAGSGFSKLAVVKRLRQNLAEEQEFIEMLVDEARISARLNHPNVVQTNEVGSVGNHYFLAMEYLDGQPLHRIQHRASQQMKKAAESGEDASKVFPPECHLLVLADALAGLHHAHELQDYDGTPLDIVHRDVTPHNIFVTYEGQVKVVDFGIAKAAGRTSETRQGVVKGKIRYMAPEQARGQKVDRRADIFSVGIMLWEIVTKKRLWQGLEDMAIVQKLVSGDFPASPRSVDASIPEELDRMCRKALAVGLDDRYQTAEDLRVDIEQYLAESALLVPARRKMGACVSALFQEKRAEIRNVIDQQLAALKIEAASDGPSLVTVPIAMDSIGSTTSATPSKTGESIARVTLRGTTSSTSQTGASTDSSAGFMKLVTGSKPRLALAATAALLLVVIVGLSMTRNGPAEAKQGQTTASSASPAAADVTPMVHVHLAATPDTARITLDGVAVSSPYDARVPRDTTMHVVRVEAPGYEARAEKLLYTSDVSLDFPLQKSAAPGDEAKHSASAAPVATGAGPWKPATTAAAAASAHPDTPAPPTAEPIVQPVTSAAVVTPPASASGRPKPPKPTIDTSEDPWANKH